LVGLRPKPGDQSYLSQQIGNAEANRRRADDRLNDTERQIGNAQIREIPDLPEAESGSPNREGTKGQVSFTASRLEGSRPATSRGIAVPVPAPTPKNRGGVY
jgi:hypothetical protein